jgi:hypothetical protein
MPSAAVDAAFHARLTANWSLCPVVTVNLQTEVPESEDAFLVVQYPIQDGSQPGLGRRYFEEGAARFVLNVKVGTGLDGLAMADTLASLFRDRWIADGLQTFAPSAPMITDVNDEGNWFVFSVIVPYRYQFDDGGNNSPA